MTILNEHLEHRVNQNLLANSELSSQRIDVTADAGIVTLHGEVQSFKRKLTAQEVAMADENVREVRNELVVRTPSGHSEPFLAELVNRLIDNVEGLSNESILIASNGNKITISGYVSNDREKINVEDIARSVDGVQEVTNLLIVNPDEVFSNREHCEKIRASISEIIGLAHAELRLSVVNETARLSGWVNSLWMKEAAEAEARRFGILTLANDIVVQSED